MWPSIDKEPVKAGLYCPLCFVEQMEGHKWHTWYFGCVPNRPPPEEAEASSRGGRGRLPRRQSRGRGCRNGCIRGYGLNPEVLSRGSVAVLLPVV